jgi:nucleoside-diphosphate-sugar epimerase
VTTLIIGCGYLGQRVGAILSRGGEQVFGTVRSEARAAEIAANGIDPVIADVLDRPSLCKLPAAQRVFYSVGFDRGAGASMRSVYVDGLSNVLDSLSRQVTRLVYASSTGVYGQTEGEWVDEETPPDPRTDSGRVCLEAENRLQGWALECDHVISVVTLRFAGLYGPGRVVRRTLAEKGAPIPGDPSKVLNLIHVEDAASAGVAALTAASPDPIYVVSDDRPVSRREYYSLMAKLLNAPAPRFLPPEPSGIDDGRDATNKRAANRLMKARLGIKLIYPDIADGLPEALRAGSSRS